MNRRRLWTGVFVAQVSLLVGGAPISGQTQQGRTDITPTDVFAEVFATAHNIEQIRFYMGRPRNHQEAIGVAGVAPREVIYQAATLCEKTNRLGHELIREVGDKPAVPDKDIIPADVLHMVELAHARVRRIAEGLGLELTRGPAPPAGKKTPTDVYRAVVGLNRQINILLDRRFSPSEGRDGWHRRSRDGRRRFTSRYSSETARALRTIAQTPCDRATLPKRDARAYHGCRRRDESGSAVSSAASRRYSASRRRSANRRVSRWRSDRAEDLALGGTLGPTSVDLVAQP